MGTPWLLRPWEVLRLTDRQICDVYFHLRDEDGRLREGGCDAGDVTLDDEPTPEEAGRAIRSMMKAFGVPESELKRVPRGE